MNRNEYRRTALRRLEDAEVLLRARRFDGAYYLAGYVVECALKACIARGYRSSDVPEKQRVLDFYNQGHDLVRLARLAGLEPALLAEMGSDKAFGARWQTVQAWRVESRYQSQRRAVEARDMVDGVANPSHGVLQWLKRHW